MRTIIFGMLLVTATLSCHREKAPNKPEYGNFPLVVVRAFKMNDEIVYYLAFKHKLIDQTESLISPDNFNTAKAIAALNSYDKFCRYAPDDFEITEISFHRFLSDNRKYYGLIRRKFVGDGDFPESHKGLLVTPFFPDGSILRYGHLYSSSGQLIEMLDY